MKNVSELYQKTQHPVRILQFGEGNFLRAFEFLHIRLKKL